MRVHPARRSRHRPPALPALGITGLALVGLALLMPIQANASPAEDPVDLSGAYVLDRSGVLGGDTSAVRAAIDRLYDERGTQLFVVFVEEFTGASSDQDWANESAILSGLGDRDVLLAIATEDRVFRYSVSEAFPLSSARLDEVAENDLIPALRVDDWEGGAVAFANGLSAAQEPSAVPLVVGGVVVAGVGTAIVVGVVRRRSSAKQAQDAEQATVAELDQRAGRLLVELDDAIKTSEQELGFAQAQFGEAQTRDFAAALASAQATAQQAFALRQQLDDAFPETPEQHRAMTIELIELAEKADATLDEQADAFDELRKLDRDASTVLETVAAEHAGLAARIEAAEAAIASLAARTSKAELAPIAGVPEQARKLTAFAATAVETARAEIAKPKGEAAVAVRAAQQAVGQVGQLLASVDTFSSELDAQAALKAEAAAELDKALQRARSQVALAQDYITTHRGAIGSTARTRVSEADRHLTAALGLAGSDPAAALSEARDADRLAGAAIQSARADVSQYEERLSMPTAGASGSSGADGAGLGGILGDLLFGGSSNSGSAWSWGGGGGGWSSSRPSGFGGSSRRSSSSSRRSSGSSSRSSGRRGGGGRF